MFMRHDGSVDEKQKDTTPENERRAAARSIAANATCASARAPDIETLLRRPSPSLSRVPAMAVFALGGLLLTG